MDGVTQKVVHKAKLIIVILKEVHLRVICRTNCDAYHGTRVTRTDGVQLSVSELGNVDKHIS